MLSNATILNPKVLDLTIAKISKSLLNTIRENNIELDVIIGETEIAGLILTKNKNELEIPIVVDYQNFWPEELVEHRIIKRNSRRYKYLINLEEEVLSNSDMIFNVIDTLKEFLLHYFTELFLS